MNTEETQNQTMTTTRNDDVINFTRHSPGKKEHYTNFEELALDVLTGKDIAKLYKKIEKELKRREKEEKRKEKEAFDKGKKAAKRLLDSLDKEEKELNKKHAEERKKQLAKRTFAEEKCKEFISSFKREDRARKHEKWNQEQEIFIQTKIQTYSCPAVVAAMPKSKKKAKPSNIEKEFRKRYPNTNRNKCAIISKINALKTIYNQREETELRGTRKLSGKETFKKSWHI
jgi:hypothetical protein